MLEESIGNYITYHSKCKLHTTVIADIIDIRYITYHFKCKLHTTPISYLECSLNVNYTPL